VKAALLLASLVLGAITAQGQVVAITGGSSTEVQATGGSVSLYLPSSALTFSGGLAQNGPVFGGTADLIHGQSDFRFGDQAVLLDAGSLSLSEPVRGLSLRRQNLTAYVGQTGSMFSTPFLSSYDAHGIGAGLSYRYRGWSLAAATDKTAIEGFTHHWTHFNFNESAGWVLGRFATTAQAGIHTQHFNVTAGQNLYIYQGRRTTGENESLSLNDDGVWGFASFFQSGTIRGSALGASYGHGPVNLSASEMLSTQHSFLGSVTEHLGQRLHVAEYVSRSGNQTSLSLGGGFDGNLASVDVGYQQMFFPFLPREPFRKVMTINLRLQLPWKGITLTADTVATPTGRTHWTAYGTTYVDAPWLASTGQGLPVSGRKISDNDVLQGSVTDDSGNPIEGAAIRVGKSEVYSNQDGSFETRLKPDEEVTIFVVLDDFTAPGCYSVVKMPRTSRLGDEIHIILRQQPCH
jgi:hypothetical protein